MIKTDALFLFDIDGTLVTSPTKAGGRAFEEALQRIKKIDQGMKGITLHGNTDIIILEEVWQSHFGCLPPADESEIILNEYLRCLEDALKKPGAIEILPDVHQTLALLKPHSMVGLATGNVIDGARIKLEATGLWQEFKFGGYGSDARERAGLVRVAMQRAQQRHGKQFKREEVWIIGDTPKDVQAAQQVGVRSIAVATGVYSVQELQKTGADYVLSTLSDLAAHLDPRYALPQ